MVYLHNPLSKGKYPYYDRFRLGNIPDDLKEEIGTPDTYGTLTITRFFLARKIDNTVTPLFVLPKDIVRIKGEDKGVILLQPEENLNINFVYNMPLPALTPLWGKIDEPLEEIGGFLTSKSFNKYLIGDCPEEVIKNEDLYKREERVGIGKDRKTKSAKPGLLYSVEYFRFDQGVGFALELVGIKSLPDHGLLRLGGDHRSAFYQKMDFLLPDKEGIKEKLKITKRFKLILLTPAIFSNGWLPAWIDSQSAIGRKNDLMVRLVSAAIGRPAYIGGFDLARGRPKHIEKTVPAGSVYYFEIKEGTLSANWKPPVRIITKRLTPYFPLPLK